jgi:hypothetical protein
VSAPRGSLDGTHAFIAAGGRRSPRDLPEASSRRLRSEPRALRAMPIIPEKMHAPPPLGPSGRGP